MRKNTLFTFIHSKGQVLDADDCRKIGGLSFQRQNDAGGRCYYICDLEAKKDAMLLECHILEHHLTVYREEDPDNAMMGPYHYTATLLAKDGTQKKLHVYFGARDQVLIKPTIDKRYCNDPELEEILAHTTRQIQLPVGKLRTLLQQEIRKLETGYGDKAKEFARLQKESKDYEKLLSEINEILAQIISYDRGHHYRHLSNYYRRLFFELKQRPFLTPHLASASVDMPTKQSVDWIEMFSDTAPIPKVNDKIDIEKEIVDLKRALTKYKESDKSLIGDFIYISVKLSELDTYSDDHLSDAIRVQLDDLYNEVELIGQDLIRCLLLKDNNYSKEAVALSGYIGNKALTFLELALVGGNYKLLEFILNHTEIPINTTLIKDKPLIRFCLEFKYADLEKQKGCLDVLIRNGASLFTETADGLPVLYHIISGVKKTFREILQDNFEKIFNKSNLSQLIKLLENYKNIVLEGKDAPEIDLITNTCRSILKELDFSSPKVLSKRASNLIDKLPRVVELFNIHDIERLQFDPQVIMYRDESQTLEKKYFEILGNHSPEIAKYLKNKKEWTDALVAMSIEFPRGSFYDLDYETLKKSHIEVMEKNNRLLTLSIKLKEMQSEGKHFKKNARQKPIVDEINQLIRELDGFNSEHMDINLAGELDDFNKDHMEDYLEKMRKKSIELSALLKEFIDLNLAGELGKHMEPVLENTSKQAIDLSALISTGNAFFTPAPPSTTTDSLLEVTEQNSAVPPPPQCPQ